VIRSWDASHYDWDRGPVDVAAASSMTNMIGADTEPTLLHGLRVVLARTPATPAVRDRVARLLDMTAALAEPA
jgi:hypothetical protein